MKVLFEVEDRDTAYVILDVDSIGTPLNSTVWNLSFEGVEFGEIENEGLVVWLENVSIPAKRELKVVPQSTIDWDTAYDDPEWVPIPCPILLLNWECYELRYEV